MRGRSFQNRITTGRTTLPVAVLVALGCWLVGGMMLPSEHWTAWSGSTLWQLAGLDRLPLQVSLPMGFVLHGLAGWLLIELNNAYAIIRMRASVQTTVYLLLTAACPALYVLYAGSVGLLLFLVALYFLFGSYQQKRLVGGLFYSFLFLGLGSMVVPQLVWLVPVFWLGAYLFRSLHFRSFFASLFGWALPYWFLLAHAYFYGQMELFCQPFREMVYFAAWHPCFHPNEWAVLAYLFVLYAVSTFHCLLLGYEDKIRTRSYLHFLILLCFCLFAYVVAQPVKSRDVLPLLLAGVGILSGHFFALTSSRGSNWFFIGAMVALCALFVLNVWMLW